MVQTVGSNGSLLADEGWASAGNVQDIPSRYLGQKEEWSKPLLCLCAVIATTKCSCARSTGKG